MFIEKKHLAEVFVGLSKWGYLESSKFIETKASPTKLTIPTITNHIAKETATADSLADLTLLDLNQRIRSCTDCSLCKSRTKAVAGTGPSNPLVMIVGDFPGVDEDAIGLPFVGAAGQFLDKWLDSIGLNRYSNTYLTNSVKCYPASEGAPDLSQFEQCSKYLKVQVSRLKPRLIVILGQLSSQTILKTNQEMDQLRGRFFDLYGIPCVPIYHPAEVLRKPELKRLVWEDLKRIREKLSIL